MNKYDGSGGINWLFLDLNSFFASCEQQLQPQLRGKPVAVLPVLAETTSAIAASYEAKRRGVKTNTSVRDARRLCPEINFVVARPKKYVELHHEIIKAIEACWPIEKVCSIDEFALRLTGRHCVPEHALALAKAIKQSIATQVGTCLTSSIGLAPNCYLAKIGTELQKPNGLVILPKESLPQALFGLQLRDFTGISTAMENRLNSVGIFTAEDLCLAPAQVLRAAWGGVEGLRMHALLRGEEVVRPPTRTSSISHQHVLEPELRHADGARQFLRYLLMKAAQRLRAKGFYASALTVAIKYTRDQLTGRSQYWDATRDFAQTQDTRILLHVFEQIWRSVPASAGKPLRVAAVLHGLVPSTAHQPDLFSEAEAAPHNRQLLAALDKVNTRFGTGSVGFGVVRRLLQRGHHKGDMGDGRIAFQRVPELHEYGR